MGRGMKRIQVGKEEGTMGLEKQMVWEKQHILS